MIGKLSEYCKKILKTPMMLLKLPVRIHKALNVVFLINSEQAALHKALQIKQNSGYSLGGKFVYFLNDDEGNRCIYEKLMSGSPVLIGRHGGTELDLCVEYDLHNRVKSPEELCFNSGFFPCDRELAKKWILLYQSSLKLVDCLCEWNQRCGKHSELEHMYGKYTPDAEVINNIEVLTPFFHDAPWTKALKGKRVLVIHPFVKTIESQYRRRSKLFKNKEFLPEFEELLLLRSVQTMVGHVDPRFSSWFDAFDYMCEQIDSLDFDVALIGCGCYGLVLASYVKSLGKSAVHMGGGLQLLFGIRGHRWDSNQGWIDQGLYNDYWVRPSHDETPKDFKGMEGGAYW